MVGLGLKVSIAKISDALLNKDVLKPELKSTVTFTPLYPILSLDATNWRFRVM